VVCEGLLLAFLSTTCFSWRLQRIVCVEANFFPRLVDLAEVRSSYIRRQGDSGFGFIGWTNREFVLTVGYYRLKEEQENAIP
jgi:hypothetical protein